MMFVSPTMKMVPAFPFPSVFIASIVNKHTPGKTPSMINVVSLGLAEGGGG